MKTLQPLPKSAYKSYENHNEWHKICELHHTSKTIDVSPCSHFDHCERDAVIWVYTRDSSPFPFGLCNQCYNACYPTNVQWYRVVHIGSDFKGKL